MDNAADFIALTCAFRIAGGWRRDLIPCLVFCMPESLAKKEAHQWRASFDPMGIDQAVLTSRVAVSSVIVSLPRMKARRSGLITNRASKAAVALSATAITNTACQPKLVDTMLASGTSSEPVPWAVANDPIVVVAYLTPNVSPLVAGNRLYISPNTPK